MRRPPRRTDGSTRLNAGGLARAGAVCILTSFVSLGLMGGASARLIADDLPPVDKPGPTTPAFIRGVVVDPADYLALVPSAATLAKQLVDRAVANGVNTIYLNAYNVEYGAYYRTAYRFNQESPYGRQDLLGKLIAAAHARGIGVYAAVYDHQHRGAWEANPSWRAKTDRGSDYNPARTDIQYYLSVGHPLSSTWWLGFLRDLLSEYPTLDGVEIREPIINWWGTEADHNPAVEAAFRAKHAGARTDSEEWRTFRRHTLTTFVREEISLIHSYGVPVHVTTVADAWGNGRLLSAGEEARETGFDLDALLSGSHKPDAVKVELIWQQWARVYDYVTFTPEWTGRALREFLGQVRGRAPVILHIELTDFGRHIMSPAEFLRALQAGAIPGIAGLDFYSAFLADGKKAWPAVRSVYGPAPASMEPPDDRRVLVLFDDPKKDVGANALRRMFALNLANLLGHFDVTWDVQRVEDYERGDLADYATVFYQGTVYGNAPQSFLSDAAVFDRTIVWIGQNLFQLRDNKALPLTQATVEPVTGYNMVRYGASEMPAAGDVIPTRASTGATTIATLRGSKGATPYIIRARTFWYVAGSPFSNLDQPNGRYLAFADALHDMLGIAHRTTHRAFLRVEDVDPLASPKRLRRLADLFAHRRVPFMVGVIPFFVDPSTNRRVSLTERPEVVKALRYMVERGGALVLHGSSHQYDARTGIDYEFWNAATQSGVAQDGEAFVRPRIERALQEMWRAGLHPLAWETPHYAATPFDYALFGEYFTTFVERRVYGVWDGKAYQQPMPYQIDGDVYGARIIPENLGYIRAPDDVDMIADSARDHLAVRDGVVGAFLHQTVSPALAGALVDRLFRNGYTFLDLYQMPNVVTTPTRVEVSGFGWASAAVPSGWYLREAFIARNGTTVRQKVSLHPSYERLTRSLPDVPYGGIYSMQVVEKAGNETPFGDPRPIALIGSSILVASLALAAIGVVLLIGSYVRLRTQRAGVITR